MAAAGETHKPVLVVCAAALAGLSADNPQPGLRGTGCSPARTI